MSDYVYLTWKLLTSFSRVSSDRKSPSSADPHLLFGCGHQERKSVPAEFISGDPPALAMFIRYHRLYTFGVLLCRGTIYTRCEKGFRTTVPRLFTQAKAKYALLTSFPVQHARYWSCSAVRPSVDLPCEIRWDIAWMLPSKEDRYFSTSL